mgnify:CR=1 FL=1|tara:strand:- start:47309 stop:47725 length:417 start_codon:yes stop_codon:yes gene_type:complete
MHFLLYTFVIPLLFQTSNFEGKWVTVDDETGIEKSIITLYVQNYKLYGKIDTLLLEEDKGQTCTNCKGSEKNMPIEGLLILKGLIKDGNSWTGGSILDPANGKEYDCTLTLSGTTKLKVRGFIGFSFLGRTQIWKRLE